MKKALLSMAAIALTALASNAETATLDFTGTADVYGLTRQKFSSGVQPANVTNKQPEIVLEQGDAIFTFTRKEGEPFGTDSGWALVAGTVANPTAITNGLYTSGASSKSSATYQWPLVSVTVPGGKITSVNLWAYQNVSSLTVCAFGGKEVTGVSDSKMGNSLKYTWADADAAENNVISWTPTTQLFGSTFIRKIEIEYTMVAGDDQLPNDLAFSASEATVIKRYGNTVDVPTLSNEHDLPLTWSSDNENVATVDENGKVTLVAPGQARITASFAGNNEYVKGAVSYLLKVIGNASNIKDMFALAPNAGDVVYVNFPMIVNYYNNASGGEYVSDYDGNGALVRAEKATSNDEGTETSTEPWAFSTGQVIPEGWFATNTPTTTGSSWIQWIGSVAKQVDIVDGNPVERDFETVPVSYTVVDNITHADAYKTLVVKNVTVTTPGGDDVQYTGTTSAGNTITIQNSFGIGVPAGTWDVTGIVQYAVVRGKEYFFLMPIGYSEPAKLEFPESFDVTANSTDVTIEQGEEDDIYTIVVTGTSPKSTVDLTFNLPEGWDGLIGQQMGFGSLNGKKRVNALSWQTIEDFMKDKDEENIEKGTTLTFPTNQTTMGGYYLYSGDQVEIANPVMIMVMVQKVELTIPDEIGGSVNVSGPSVVEKEVDGERVFSVTGSTKESEFVLTLEVPDGWDGYIGSTDTMMNPDFGFNRAPAVREGEWVSIDTFLNMGMVKTNSFTFPADGEDHEGKAYLYSGDEVYAATPISFDVNVSKAGTVGVETIEGEGAGIRYFNLQGVEIAKPENGLYIKVEGNKAQKTLKK